MEFVGNVVKVGTSNIILNYLILDIELFKKKIFYTKQKGKGRMFRWLWGRRLGFL